MDNNYSNIQKFYDAFSPFFPKMFTPLKKNTHRCIFLDSKNKLRAANYTNFLMTLKAETINAKKVLDLGCGFGETLAFMSLNSKQKEDEYYNESNFNYYGIVASALELGLAKDLLIRNYNMKNCKPFLGDYNNKDTYKFFTNIDFAYAIESISYTHDLSLTLNRISDALKNYGEFIICDVFFKEKINKEFYIPPMDLMYKTQMEEESFVSLAKNFDLELIDKKDFTKEQRLGSKPISIFIPASLRKSFMKIYKAQKYISEMLKNNQAQYLYLNFKKNKPENPNEQKEIIEDNHKNQDEEKDKE